MNPDNCSLAQRFGVNPQAYPGLLGHPGDDFHCGYGSTGHSPVDQLVYKVLTVDNPANDGSGFTGVFGIVDNGIELYELLVGHCDPMVVAGDYVVKGQNYFKEANHGYVFQDGVQITLAMQKAGDHRGSHRHFQKRPVYRTARTYPWYKYLTTNQSDLPAGSFYRDDLGNYYQIWNYSNGYHGCVDPSAPVFTRTLQLGSTGYDVFCLQRIFVKSGLLTPNDCIGVFGPKTYLALKAYQKTHNTPAVGTVGPITRAALNSYIATL